jgi:hypothetical protein
MSHKILLCGNPTDTKKVFEIPTMIIRIMAGTTNLVGNYLGSLNILPLGSEFLISELKF